MPNFQDSFREQFQPWRLLVSLSTAIGNEKGVLEARIAFLPLIDAEEHTLDSRVTAQQVLNDVLV